MKIWSPNSPFEGVCVFNMDKAERWARMGRARVLPLNLAMAIAARITEPRKWARKWMRDKLGVPKTCGDLILVFNGDFVVKVHTQAMEQATTILNDKNYDQMVDDGRRPDGNSHEGIGVWTSRPSQPSKMPGAPTQKVRSMHLVYRA